MSSYKFCSLSFETTANYNTNLETLLTLIKQTSDYSLIVAPEVCLTGFDYDNFDEVCEFSTFANEEIRKVSHHKIIVFTMIEKRGDKVYNFAKLFHNGKVLHERAKAKLFRFGGEEKFFSEANEDEVQIVEVDGMKIGILICFELRFKALWQKLEGSDVIVVPSWWGALRALHFKALTNALAIMNQCYVIASDSQNRECTGLSGIITPQGIEERNGNKPCLELEYNKKEISLMRRYMNVGIDG
ncbi:carbon-nitrogen hydrolase family protein [bacterium]|jgi:omega-amidase|nr:carbon-nitrogen hydrolase family protein [bacterium]MBU1433647.1 carbon-nitrogen hydrolase family protein [bacterium]MBU1503172.1 carbon-nitrogen hydrolase family protein [bacterium]